MNPSDDIILLECAKCGGQMEVPALAARLEPRCGSCGGQMLAVAGLELGQLPRAVLPTERERENMTIRPLEVSRMELNPGQIKQPGFRAAVAHTTDERVAREAGTVRKKKRRRNAAASYPGWDPEAERERYGLSRGARRAMVAGLVLLAIAVPAGVYFIIQQLNKQVVVPVPKPPSKGSSVYPVLMSSDLGRVNERLKAFLGAPTVEEMMKHIRDPERLRPAITAWYARHPYQPTAWKKLPQQEEMVLYNSLLVGVFDAEDYSRRPVALERVAGDFKVDWECFTGWCEVPWEEMGEKRPTTPVILRCTVGVSDYWNLDFQDSKKYSCLQLKSLDGQHTLYGYVQKGSPLELDLALEMRMQDPLLTTLRVKFLPNGTAKNQVEITEKVARGWVLTGAEK